MRRLEKKDTDHKDFIWYILKQKDKFNLNQDEIIVNSALFIVAGSETTANALSGILARLIYNPAKYQILVKEIRDAFQSDEEVRFEKLSQLTYLNAVIEEGLRIHPPVPTGLLRTVPKDGDTVDGLWIPGGVSFFACLDMRKAADSARPLSQLVLGRRPTTKSISKTATPSSPNVGSTPYTKPI